MKLIKITGALLVALMLSTNSNAQTDAKEQLVVPLSEPGKPFKLNVQLTNGSIKVIAYEGKDVIIDADTEDKKRKDDSKDRESSNGMKRITPVGGVDVS